MKIVKCKCGYAQMRYDAIGEDTWMAQALNTIITEGEYDNGCYCTECKTMYDTFDPFMVVEVTHVPYNIKDNG